MTYETIKVESDGAIARVSLNRPEKRNAFNNVMIHDLQDSFEKLSVDDAVRIIVLAGEGKLFCAGADIGWMKSSMELSNEENREDALRMANMLRTIDECPKPVIGRVHKAALGGGSGLVATCDIVVATEETKFAFSEVKLGILPAVISAFVLPKIGPAHARRYFLTAEVFASPEARRIGLIHECVPADKLDDTVNGIIQTLLTNGPRAVAEAKKFIREVASMTRDEWIPHSVETISRVRTTPEAQEGLKAFLDKRKATWIS